MAMWHMPRQIVSGPNAGKWRMTSASDEGGPVYSEPCCADGHVHDTSEEATACNREWIVSQAEVGESDTEMLRCIECNQWTNKRMHMTVGSFYHVVHLCGAHCSKEMFRKHAFTKG